MKNMTHVMLDLETLGTLPGCRIIAIGAVAFNNETGTSRSFYSEPDHNHQGNLKMEASTASWWAQQSDEARGTLFDNGPKPYLHQELMRFNEWLQSLAEVDEKGRLKLCMWGNGADFDNAILQVAYNEVCAYGPVWSPFNNRCYRTLKNLVPGIKLVREGVHHNALADARSQAEHAIRIFNYVQAW